MNVNTNTVNSRYNFPSPSRSPIPSSFQSTIRKRRREQQRTKRSKRPRMQPTPVPVPPPAQPMPSVSRKRRSRTRKRRSSKYVEKEEPIVPETNNSATNPPTANIDSTINEDNSVDVPRRNSITNSVAETDTTEPLSDATVGTEELAKDGMVDMQVDNIVNRIQQQLDLHNTSISPDELAKRDADADIDADEIEPFITTGDEEPVFTPSPPPSSAFIPQATLQNTIPSEIDLFTQITDIVSKIQHDLDSQQPPSSSQEDTLLVPRTTTPEQTQMQTQTQMPVFPEAPTQKPIIFPEAPTQKPIIFPNVPTHDILRETMKESANTQTLGKMEARMDANVVNPKEERISGVRQTPTVVPSETVTKEPMDKEATPTIVPSETVDVVDVKEPMDKEVTPTVVTPESITKEPMDEVVTPTVVPPETVDVVDVKKPMDKEVTPTIVPPETVDVVGVKESVGEEVAPTIVPPETVDVVDDVKEPMDKEATPTIVPPETVDVVGAKEPVDEEVAPITMPQELVEEESVKDVIEETKNAIPQVVPSPSTTPISDLSSQIVGMIDAVQKDLESQEHIQLDNTQITDTIERVQGDIDNLIVLSPEGPPVPEGPSILGIIKNRIATIADTIASNATSIYNRATTTPPADTAPAALHTVRLDGIKFKKLSQPDDDNLGENVKVRVQVSPRSVIQSIHDVDEMLAILKTRSLGNNIRTDRGKYNQYNLDIQYRP